VHKAQARAYGGALAASSNLQYVDPRSNHDARPNPLTVGREKNAWIGLFISVSFCGLCDLCGSLVSLPHSGRGLRAYPNRPTGRKHPVRRSRRDRPTEIGSKRRRLGRTQTQRAHNGGAAGGIGWWTNSPTAGDGGYSIPQVFFFWVRCGYLGFTPVLPRSKEWPRSSQPDIEPETSRPVESKALFDESII